MIFLGTGRLFSISQLIIHHVHVRFTKKTLQHVQSVRGMNSMLSIDSSEIFQKSTSEILTKKRCLLHKSMSSSSNIRCQSPKEVANFIKSGTVKHVVVMAGAGISTPSGIPDFRSPGTGLYDNLQKYNLPYPEAVFDIGYFDRNPKPFFTLAHELFPTNKNRPNVCHYFVRLLQERGLLKKMYTQNIDSLERSAGIQPELLVEAHGSFAAATCRVCRKKYSSDDIKQSIFDGEIPICKEEGCDGVIKPNIVFFGEQLPPEFWAYQTDMEQADLLIILGTSLEVEPFASIADCITLGVPRVLFNLRAAGPFRYNRRKNDVVFEGDITENIWQFSEYMGWTILLKELIDKSESPYQQITKDISEEEISIVKKREE